MAVLQSNTFAIADTFLETIGSQSTSGSATIDIPITEFETEIATTVGVNPAPPTEPRVLSSLGPREVAVEPIVLIGPDIQSV